MLKKLLLVASLATAAFAVTVPRPSGDLTYEVSGKGKQVLSQYKGKILLVAAILTT